ncbi:TonB-dependent receptor domain-containing protein [Sphingomonas sp. HT-1]|uniref:TonB-dependent receptor domain-containing protein n=1 Tax=unclassified Sphingomonas TaxID=196159 RepID=UPI000380242E|nr:MULTISPECIES: TonB-dependent receptor [unclassified Sphingomonas]KTF68806.1 TonB-dependent receptor [Sphingomonas sp. WG]
MNSRTVLLSLIATSALATPALAQSNADAQSKETQEQVRPVEEKEVFSTGVAKGRDRLDSATSTSSLKGIEAQKLGPVGLADILRTMAGIRVENGISEGNNNYTVRGLPIGSGGSKYVQIEEDGLPVVEFNDIFNMAGDSFVRADFTIAQIETIRGGSASTFATGSPGGLINLISKTGDVEGGSIQMTAGLDYDLKRIDFDYGAKLSDSLRFHVGGFYRVGEGPRATGMTSFKGGQLKLNVTKQFSNGYIRAYAKLLDDRAPSYATYPVTITGTNDKPVIGNIAGFDILKDTMFSPNVSAMITLDGNNQPARYPVKNGQNPQSKSLGLEAQFDLGGWTLTNRMRYADTSGEFLRGFPSTVAPMATLAASLAGAGATATYATGPNAGKAVPGSANGNGLLANFFVNTYNLRNGNHFANDFRGTRVWKVGQGDLTVTGGLYVASQTIAVEALQISMVTDVVGGGQGSLVNLTSAAGVAQTQDGIYAYSRNGPRLRRSFDVDYSFFAPYASVNYHIGKIAIGGSLRYDTGSARGWMVGADLGDGRNGTVSYDMNGDGRISAPETRVSALPLGRPAPVNYNFKYLSYSAGINYRAAEPLAFFARYSRGGRANADKILFTSAIDNGTGKLTASEHGFDIVRQLEGGLKFRKNGITLNATSFLAYADDHNQLNATATWTYRTYRTYGLELEGGIRRGPFSMVAGATYTKAKITEDKIDPTLTGKEPRHQPAWTLQATPQVDTKYATIGASVVTITSSYAQDVNQLKMPGFTTVGGFVILHPTKAIDVALTGTNLFNAKGFLDISQSTMPTTGIGWARSVQGRTLAASVRFNF